MTQTIRSNDKDLQANVTDELRFNPSIDAALVGVSVDDGVVTLSGNVRSLPERHAAKRAAMRVCGVKTISDNMVVRNPDPSGPKDTDIRDAANQMLSWTVDVPSDAVKVSVHDHTITLSGTVAWQYQREAAARAVMSIKGITSVNNTISLTTTAPNTGLKAVIDAAIKRNAQLDSREITAEITGGDVKLHGNVRSCAERRQAENVAWSAAGVTSVHNNLNVTS